MKTGGRAIIDLFTVAYRTHSEQLEKPVSVTGMYVTFHTVTIQNTVSMQNTWKQVFKI
jgi:hypothetical protein